MSLHEINAVTLASTDMTASCDFYRRLGFEISSGGPDGDFTSFRIGGNHLNLTRRDQYHASPAWGRVIFYVSDVDAFYQGAVEAGLRPEAPPADATWGERYFHILDPDGHELSFASPLKDKS